MALRRGRRAKPDSTAVCVLRAACCVLCAVQWLTCLPPPPASLSCFSCFALSTVISSGRLVH